MGSIFSKIITGEINAYKIAEDENFIAFLDIMPLKKGHTLVVPKLELDYLFDISDDLLRDLMVFFEICGKKN
jgi:histidine triad (HIT) family protein